MKKYPFSLSLSALLCFFSACSSYEQFRYIMEDFEIASKVFQVNYPSAWQAANNVMKDYDLQSQSQATGEIRSGWRDNTQEINFADSFGGADSVKAAKFKLLVNITKGYQDGREVCRVTVLKRQMVEQDFLQGWRVVPTDGILERQILYRISRVLAIEQHLKKIEEVRKREQEEPL